MTVCTHCGFTHDMTGPACPITKDALDQPGLCGTTLDRYQIENWLGGGGFGAVYSARHTVMDRLVALKVLHAQMRMHPQAVKRFFGEAKAATAIGSPRIVQVFDAGTGAGGHAFLAMELIDGCSLKELAEGGLIAPVRAIRISLGVLEALAAAHHAGIIHRDVKPGNVMLGGTSVDGSRSEDEVRLVDFGVSKARQTKGPEDLTRSGMAMGSPGYAAPEQYVSAKDADARSDLYGVSVILYRLLSGNMPFEAESYEQMVIKVCTIDPRPLGVARPDVPDGLSTIIDRGLARDPQSRWQSAEDLIAALTPWLAYLEGNSAPIADASGTHMLRPAPPPVDSFRSDMVPISVISIGPQSSARHPIPGSLLEAGGELAEAPTGGLAVEVPAESGTPKSRRGAMLATLAAVVIAAGVVAGLLIARSANQAAPPAAVGNHPVPVVPVAVPGPGSEGSVVTVVLDSAARVVPRDASNGVVAPVDAGAIVPPVADPAPAMTRTGGRRGTRGGPRGMRPAMTAETMTQMGRNRGFGLEDIEPFDSN